MKHCLFGVGAFVLALGMTVGLRVQAEIDPNTQVSNTVQRGSVQRTLGQSDQNVDIGTNRATADETQFSLMRSRWRNRLMVRNPDLNNPNVNAYLIDLAGQSKTLWNTMDRRPDRKRLWAKKSSDTTSADYTTTFTNIKLLTLGYYNPKSEQYQDPAVYRAILDAIDFMINVKQYNGTFSTGNWWDWQIGAAQQLDDTLILLYDDLQQQDPQRLRRFVQPLLGYAKDPNIQWPKYTATGANLTDISISVLASGLLLEDDHRVALVQANLPKAMGLVTAKDGIYADGSFIQHTFFPYNASYGNEMIKGIARISSTLVGTPWAISEVQFANVFNLIDKGFLQLMVNGRMPSMVSGRSISRAPGTNPETTELETGKETLANLTLIAEAAPAGLKQKIYQAVATWVAQVGDYYNFFNNPRDYAALNGLKTALSQATAQENDQDSLNVYGSMDRVMQKTSKYAVGLAMYSNRIANFEYGNTENAHAWHTADGMLYLYNRDFNQFGEGYWTTVDPYRLPGTTVDTAPLADGAKSSSRSPQSWVGGATDGIVASVGMVLDKTNEGQNLKAMKSWFLLNDQIVNLGAGISGMTKADIETILDQRQIDPLTTKITIDGHTYVNQETAKNWVNLNTNDPSNNVGYIIAKDNDQVDISRATRTGSYKDINGYFPSDTVYRHHYVTLAAKHGSAVKDGKYEYVTVPGASDSTIAALAKKPKYQVLANTNEVQAIKTQDQIMANIWNKASLLGGLLEIDQPVSLVIKDLGENTYQLTATDPRQSDDPINFNFKYPVHIREKQADGFSVNQDLLMLKTKGLAGASRTVVVSVDVPTDKAALEGLISHAENVKATEYTPSSYGKLMTVLASAKAVYADAAAKQVVVDQAKAALEDALKKLVKVADTSALKTVLAIINKLKREVYTSESWQKLQDALIFGKVTLKNVESTQETVDYATKLLVEAQHALIKKDVNEASKHGQTTRLGKNGEDGRHDPEKMPNTGEKGSFIFIIIGFTIIVLTGIVMFVCEKRENQTN